MRRSLRTRLALILTLLMGGVLVVMGATFFWVRARDQRATLESHAVAFAQSTTSEICAAYRLYYGSGSLKFREIVGRVSARDEDLHRLLVLSVTGDVLYDSLESPDWTLLPDRPRRRLEDPELVAAAARHEVFVKRQEAPQKAYLVMAPYFEEWGRHPYSVLFVYTYENMRRRVLASLAPTVLVGLFALGVVGIVAQLLAGRVVRPILRLTQDVRLFSEGRDRPLSLIETGDEIQVLSETFRKMAVRLSEQVDSLENVNRELATLDRLKTDLLANVSHELRTPLAAIRGYVEFIQEGQLGPITEGQRKGLDVCLRNAERLTRTINMLLDFSRMELGRVSIRPAPFQIGRLIAQVVAGIESEAARRSIRLDTRIAHDLRPVDGDRDRLTQVLENLLTNALKFTPEGGQVEIAARPVDRGQRVEVSVSDTGPGIPAAERARVFDKFYQSDASATRKFGGIGLGLAIVKSILDAHGAPISVDDRQGGGTVFRFSLPAVETRTESGIFPGLAFTAGSSAADVLAIDDDADFLSLIRETLSKQGFSVRTVGTAEGGLAMALEQPPRLIVLDIRLPDRDGLDLLHQLRTNPKTKDVPILIVSVLDERLEGLRLGAVDYLVKPIDRVKLVEAATRALGRTPFPGGRLEPSAAVLVVDDEEEVRTLLTRALRVHGFRAEAAANAEDALQRAREGLPDVILLDIVLPDRSGWDLLEDLRAGDETRNIHVIVLTAHDDPGDVERARRIGVEGFLAKPIDMNRIMEKIKGVLSKDAALERKD